MADQYTVGPSQPVVVPGSGYGSQTVENLGPDTVYHAAGGTVSAGLNEGTLAPGSSLTIATTTAFLAQLSTATLTVTANRSLGASSLGIYLPPGWGANWQAKRNAAGSAQARVAILGDSIGRGYFSSDLSAKAWMGIAATALRSQWGDGGSGFQSVADTATPWMSGQGIPTAARTAYGGKGNLITAAGSWTVAPSTQMPGGTFGPGGAALVAGAATDTLTANVRGTTVKVFYLNQTPSTGYTGLGQFTVNIDGAGAQTVTPSGAGGIGVATFSGLSVGTHSVVVTATGWTAAANAVVVQGFQGENATGVLVNNFSRYGETSANYGNNDTLKQSAWCGGYNNPADLFIWTLAVNDCHTAIGQQNYGLSMSGHLATVIDTIKGGTTQAGQTDLLIVIPHIGNYEPNNSSWIQYTSFIENAARQYGAALIDFNPLGRRSYQYWKNLGYWAVTDGSGGAGSDAVHPSDAGHQYMANQVTPLLTA